MNISHQNFDKLGNICTYTFKNEFKQLKDNMILLYILLEYLQDEFTVIYYVRCCGLYKQDRVVIKNCNEDQELGDFFICIFEDEWPVGFECIRFITAADWI